MWRLLCLGLAVASTSASLLQARADCTVTTAQSGEGCYQVAQRCGITEAQFRSYNGGDGICNTMKAGQRVCCSSGTLPSRKPKQNSDGSCFSYTLQKDDGCWKIGQNTDLTEAEIDGFNNGADGTWGWQGCKGNNYEGLKICLSPGTPPLPASVSNAICGPTKPGTSAIKGVKMADLNPCKLNACCNIWGQCGITPEFCTISNGPTGNPGTSPKGQNGCISNCGVKITNVKTPSTQVNVAYYEQWNWDRQCNNMRVDDIDKSRYSHIHWAFVNIDPNTFHLIPNNTWGQFDRFKSLSGIKKVISIGGWTFSTELNTYDILRRGMSNSNSEKFANSIVDFLKQNNLDGIDIDWEYPGAPDNQGNPLLPPTGNSNDGVNYWLFLYKLRQKMPFGGGKSISIAAPASYWYLKAFPIAAMAQHLDYIVYMTYDLHGQWDYNNKWSQEGCPGGNCLRSHVNSTETFYALSMLTKAGVSTDKIVVGVTSYGRSFGMSSPWCVGATCLYKGPSSYAFPGVCTGTAGYISNVEIQMLIDAKAQYTLSWYDKSSDSDMVRYGDVNNGQWVAYMSDVTKARRAAEYKANGFLGVTDWAVSLQGGSLYESRPDDQDDASYFDSQPVGKISGCPNGYSTLGQLEYDLAVDANRVPRHCLPRYMVTALQGTLKTSLYYYDGIMKNDYDSKFKTYARAVMGNGQGGLNTFMEKRGDEFFTCRIEEYTWCCKECKSLGASKPPQDGCRNCHNQACHVENGRTPGVDKRDNGTLEFSLSNITDPFTLEKREMVPNLIAKVVDEKCPPDYSQRGWGQNNPYQNKIWWKLKGDEKAFWTAIVADTNIPQNRIKFGNTALWYGTPLLNGYTEADVANPKDILQKALGKTGSLTQQLDAAYSFATYNSLPGDPAAYLDAVSLPVTMIADAVDQMRNIVETAEQIKAAEEARKKEIILAVFTALLFLIPIAGQALGSFTGMAGLAAMIVAFGAVGDVAMGVYSVIDDEDNPVAGILQIALAPLALLDLPAIGRASQLRRGLGGAKIAKFGKTVESSVNILEKVYGVCRKA